MQNTFSNRLFMLGLGLFGFACDANYPDFPVLVQESLYCAKIASFGNGELCFDGSGERDLSTCGVGSGCSPKGVCVADALYLGCACTADEDCVGWATYSNETLGSLGDESALPSCYAGGCVFAPNRVRMESQSESKDVESELEDID